MSESQPVLQIRGLTMRFGGLMAVDHFDLEVGQGEIVSLVGPNGAGKTTVFNLISGVLRASAGSIRLLGRELTRVPAHRITHAGVSRTFQNVRVFAQMTVRERPPRRPSTMPSPCSANGLSPAWTTRPTASPMPTAGGPRWPAPWRRARNCSSSTSRRPE